MSGIHQGTVRLSDDNKTILFLPSTPFLPSEDVRVQVAQDITTTDGVALPVVIIHFKTTPLSQPLINISQSYDGTNVTAGNTTAAPRSLRKTSGVDTVPSNFPQITIGTSNNPAPGSIFITNLTTTANASIGSYLMIANNDGSVAKYKALPAVATLFKMESNGELSFDFSANSERYIMDTSLTTIDSLQCGNGYSADQHDGILLQKQVN